MGGTRGGKGAWVLNILLLPLLILNTALNDWTELCFLNPAIDQPLSRVLSSSSCVFGGKAEAAFLKTRLQTHSLILFYFFPRLPKAAFIKRSLNDWTELRFIKRSSNVNWSSVYKTQLSSVIQSCVSLNAASTRTELRFLKRSSGFVLEFF